MKKREVAFVSTLQLPEASREIAHCYDERTSGRLLYYRARYYDPVLKRFISEDPIGIAGGINLYAYVYGVPTRLVDPEGKLIDVVAAAIEPFHVAYAYGMAGITLGSAAFIVGYGAGTLVRLGIERWIIEDSIGGKWHDWRNPMPPMNVPPPPAPVTCPPSPPRYPPPSPTADPGGYDTPTF